MKRFRSGQLVSPPSVAFPIPPVTNATDDTVYWPLYTIMPTYGPPVSPNAYQGARKYPFDEVISGRAAISSSPILPLFIPLATRPGVLPTANYICARPVNRILENRVFILCASFDHIAYGVAVVQPNAIRSSVYMSMSVDQVVVFRSLHGGIDAQKPTDVDIAPNQSQGITIETLVNVQQFPIAGRIWSLACAPTPTLVLSLRRPWVFTVPFIILLGGVFLAGFTAYLVRRMSKLWQTESLLDLWQSYSQAILLATPNPMVLVNELGAVEGINSPLMQLTGHSPKSISHVTDIAQLFSIADDESIRIDGGEIDAISQLLSSASHSPSTTARRTATPAPDSTPATPHLDFLPDIALSPSGVNLSDITTCMSEPDVHGDEDDKKSIHVWLTISEKEDSNKVADFQINMLSPDVSALLRPGRHKVVIYCAPPPLIRQPPDASSDMSEPPTQSAATDQGWSAFSSIPSAALTDQRAIDRQAEATATLTHFRATSLSSSLSTAAIPITAIAGVAPTPGHPTVSKVIVLTDLSELHARDRQLRALVRETAALNLKQRQLLLFLAHELRNPLYVVQGSMETDDEIEVVGDKKDPVMEAVGFSMAILDGLVEYIETGRALSDLPGHGTADQDAEHVNVRDLFSHDPPLSADVLATLPSCVQCTAPAAGILRKLAALTHGLPLLGGSNLFVSPERHIQLHQWSSGPEDRPAAVIRLAFSPTISDTQAAILGQPLPWLSGQAQHPSFRLLSLQLAVLSRAIVQSGGSLRVLLTTREVQIELAGCRTCPDPACRLLPLSPWLASSVADDVALPPPTASPTPRQEAIAVPVVPPPLVLPDEETLADAAGAIPPPPPPPLPLVLLVEDNRIVQKMTCRLLERAGLAVRVAEHGQEALDMLRGDAELAANVRVVLMDLQMPVMGGVECTEIIRREESGWGRDGDGNGRLPIVALTANAMAEERDRCLASGFDGFLTKPVNRETLVAALHQQIGPWW